MHACSENKEHSQKTNPFFFFSQSFHSVLLVIFAIFLSFLFLKILHGWDGNSSGVDSRLKKIKK